MNKPIAATERLHYTDAYRHTFSARAVAQRTHGDTPQIALDRTVFYAEGGGQPADYGTIDGVAVTDVQVDDAGIVWHALAAPLAADAVADPATISGSIDWPRRFDHMQQHLGQHLLSAVFADRYGLATRSFHLGARSATIDLAAASLDAAQLEAAELAVNSLIWEDRPVVARFVTPDELADLPLRKPPTVTDNIRVVSVEGVDYSACGGTHPTTTGGVGALHIRRWEKSSSGARVEFLCGGRAVADYRARDLLLQSVAAELHVAPDAIEPALRTLRENEERERKAHAQTLLSLSEKEALVLAASAVRLSVAPVVSVLLHDRDAAYGKQLAVAVAARGCVALVAVACGKSQLIVARGDGLAVDAAALLRQTIAPFGGRGGGTAALAQGGVPEAAQLEAALAAAREILAAG